MGISVQGTRKTGIWARLMGKWMGKIIQGLRKWIPLDGLREGLGYGHFSFVNLWVRYGMFMNEILLNDEIVCGVCVKCVQI